MGDEQRRTIQAVFQLGCVPDFLFLQRPNSVWYPDGVYRAVLSYVGDGPSEIMDAWLDGIHGWSDVVVGCIYRDSYGLRNVASWFWILCADHIADEDDRFLRSEERRV